VKKFFRMQIIKTELCRVSKRLKICTEVCKSAGCCAQRKLAR